MLKAGERVGDYEILCHLGSGGMASLYVARHRGAADFERRVAIKVVHPHLARDPSFLSMFVDEAKLAERVRHPNVVHIEALGEHDGAYFLAMEHVDGVSLDELLETLAVQGRGLTPEVAVSVAVAIADALHAAHETRGEDGGPLGIVHRDVSPHNVLLSRGGHVKVIDFGIAKARGRSHSTTTGAIKGKLAYMSPEQAEARPVDRRTDIFALGVVLWEMLTTRPLFDGDTDVEILDAVRRLDVSPPSTHAPDVPATLDAVVMEALAREPDERPATARELRQRLLTAVPLAATVDAPALGELLQELMGEALEERRRELDAASRGLGGGPRATVDGAAKTLPATPPSALGGRALTVPRQNARTRESGPPAPTPTTAPGSPPTRPAGRSAGPLVAGGLLVLALGGAAALLALGGSDEVAEPEPVGAVASADAGSGAAPDPVTPDASAELAAEPVAELADAGAQTAAAPEPEPEPDRRRRRRRRATAPAATTSTTTPTTPSTEESGSADVIDGVPIVTEY